MSELAPGLKHSQSMAVTAEMTPPHLRAEPIRVLATPDMVRLVEQTAIQAVQPLLKPDQTTVGTKIDIAHLAATPEGMKVTLRWSCRGGPAAAHLSLRGTDEVEKVGEGTHERFIVTPPCACRACR
jgi:predicted thioesterase